MQKIYPCLWFDDQAEEAAKFYTSVFKNSKILSKEKYEGEDVSKVSGKPEGSTMVVDFEINGQHFMALNGGPEFKFSEAISFVIDCEDQEEVDYYWEKLTSDGGEESQCGWCKDKFGVSWQVVPKAYYKLMSNPDSEKRKKVMTAMLQMKKLDISKLKEAQG